MQINSPGRRTSSMTIFAIVFLACMVLGWGTGYKLSLYHSRGDSTSVIPAAKLLSQKERPSTERIDEAPSPAVQNHQPSIYSPAIIVVALMLGLRLSVSTWMRKATMDDSGRQWSSHSNFFFFRPPPVILPSN